MLDVLRVSELKLGDSTVDVRWAPESGKAWALAFLRVHFINDGSSSSTADMLVSVCEDVTRDAVQTYQALLARIVGVGVNNDVNYRVPESELAHHFIRGNWGIQIDWTHPDPGDVFWGMEIGYVLQEDYARRQGRAG